MGYVSLMFPVFAVIVLTLYFLVPKEKQWWVLTAASFAFYACATVKGLVFILFTTVTTFLAALWLEDVERLGKLELAEKKSVWSREEKKAHKQRVTRKKQWILTLNLVANFGILFLLKYFNFVGGGVNSVFRLLGIGARVRTLHLLLPLGISFYTFQSMGYIIDVYRGTVAAEKNLARFSLYVSFFPQIIQGPIGSYAQLGHQLYEPHAFDFTRFKYGCELIFWGYFKKLVIADRAATAIYTVTGDYSAYTGGTIAFVLILYALQLYADFSAGIDISRGLAQIMGITMAENFRRPYFARTISEYWRRWHISLGDWMKNYVFFTIAVSDPMKRLSKRIRESRVGSTPAGAHVAKALPAAFASFCIFMLVGIWHGASMKYVAFGLWNGGVIGLSVLCEPWLKSLPGKLHLSANTFGFRLFQMARTMVIVLVGYVFDIAPSLRPAIQMLIWPITRFHPRTTLAQIKALPLSMADYWILLIGAVVMFCVSLDQELHPEQSLRVRLDSKPFAVRWLVIYLCLLSILLVGAYGPGYESSAFIYMQF